MELESTMWAYIVVITALTLLFAAFFFGIIFRQVSKSREFSHLERMKALELGRAIGPAEADTRLSKYQHNVFWICFWLGGAVPIAATSAAATVMTKTNLEDFGIILAMWICAAVISVASVICATILMIAGRSSGTVANCATSENGMAV